MTLTTTAMTYDLDLFDFQLPGFDEAMAKLKTRVDKLGIGQLTITRGPMVTVTLARQEPYYNPEKDCWCNELVVRDYLKQSITVRATLPVIDGYRFVARIDHTPIHIVAQAPGNTDTIPAQYLDPEAVPVCDHCHARRHRAKTYLLFNEAEGGHWMQVGSTCIRDFSSIDPERLASYWDDITSIADLANPELNEEDSGRSRRGKSHFDLLTVLDTTAAVIRIDGTYISSKMVDSGKYCRSTRSMVWRLLADRGISKEEQVIYRPYLNDIAKAREVIAWAKTITSSTDPYLCNLKQVAEYGQVSLGKHSTMGLACSMLPAYERAMGKVKAAQQQTEAPKVSEWVAAVGDKVSLKATVTLTTVIEHEAPARWMSPRHTYLYKFETSQGNILTWFASKQVDWQTPTGTMALDKGMQVTVRGTVKRLDDYKGSKQTQLTRCKVELVKAEPIEVETSTDGWAECQADVQGGQQ